jgi:opacity protein-like surface antigen
MKRAFLGVAAILIAWGHAAAEGVQRPPSRIKAPGTTLAPAWGGAYVGGGIGLGALSYDIAGEAEKWRDVQRTREVEKTRDVKKTKEVKNTKQVPVCTKYGYFCGRPTCKEWKYVSEDYYVKETYTEQETYFETEYYFEQEKYTESFRDSGTGDVGIFGTVTVGYDLALPSRWVAGGFADYDFGSQISADISIPGYSTSIGHNYSWAVGGRLGYLVTSSTLLYGTAGFTQANFDIGPFGSKTFKGYFVGAGVETLLSRSWALKLEYRYSEFVSETFSDGPVTFDLDPSMHTARVILTYKLGQ